MPKTPKPTATLQEAVASQVADLLIEAAEARQQATAASHKSDDLLHVAVTLESDAAKWEQRLNWWKFLQRKQRAKEG